MPPAFARPGAPSGGIHSRAEPAAINSRATSTWSAPGALVLRRLRWPIVRERTRRIGCVADRCSCRLETRSRIHRTVGPKRAAEALEQSVRGAPQPRPFLGVSCDRGQSRKHLETPRNPAWIVELLSNRHRLGRQRPRLRRVSEKQPQPRTSRKADAELPDVPYAPMHLDRLIKELPRLVVLAAGDGDVGKDEQRSAVLPWIRAGHGRFPRRERARLGLLHGLGPTAVLLERPLPAKPAKSVVIRVRGDPLAAVFDRECSEPRVLHQIARHLG